MLDDKPLLEWCQAATEVVSPQEAKNVPTFGLAYQAYEVWLGMHGHLPPARQHLDPIVLGSELLPHLSIIEVVNNRSDYKWVLVGERVPTIIGTRLTGKYLSEIEKQVGEIVMFRKLLDKVIYENLPIFYILRHRTTDGRLNRSYGVLLPLRDLHGDDQNPLIVAAILSASDATSGA